MHMLGTRVFLVLSLVGLIAVSCAPACADEPAAAGTPSGGTATVPSHKAQPAQPAQPAQTSAPAAPAQTSAPAVNPVTQAAVQSGVLTCVSRINQVVTYLTTGCKSTAFLFVPQKQPDQSLFSVSVQTQDLTGVTKYSSASFAPTTSGQVAAVYDTIEYLAEPPDAVQKSMFKNLRQKGMLGKDTIVLDGGPVTIFLMPAGSGCIVIKKEIVQ